jgi:predicted RNA-binding Zn-ribbon protein involved in translation (DUF1610 family)
MASDGPCEFETPDQVRGISPFFIPETSSRPKSRDLERTSNGPCEFETPDQVRRCTYCLAPLSVRVSGSRYACPEKGLSFPGRRAGISRWQAMVLVSSRPRACPQLDWGSNPGMDLLLIPSLSSSFRVTLRLPGKRTLSSRPKSRDLEMAGDGPCEFETPDQVRGGTYCLVRVFGSRYACPEKELPLPGRRAGISRWQAMALVSSRPRIKSGDVPIF